MSSTTTPGLRYKVPPEQNNHLNFLRFMFEDNPAARFSGIQLCHAAGWVFLGRGRVLGNLGSSSLHQYPSEGSGASPEVHLYVYGMGNNVLNPCLCRKN